MKKLGVLLSLIFLMALSGCISEKTQQKLSNSGPSEEVIKADYMFQTSALPANEELEESEVQGKYYSFKILKGEEFSKSSYDETTGKEIAIKKASPTGTTTGTMLISSTKTMVITESVDLILAEFIKDSITQKNIYGNGEILFPNQSVKGAYKAYEVITNKSEK